MCSSLKSSNPKIQKFLKMALSDLHDYGITLKIYKQDIHNNYPLIGYFDEIKKILAVKKNKIWLKTFVHEYSHFLQWKQSMQSHEKYLKHRKKYKSDPDLCVSRWLDNRLKYDNRIKSAFERIRYDEIHCDLIAVKLIKRYQLPIDVSTYIQEANLDILSYQFIEENKSCKMPKIFYQEQFLKSLPCVLKKSYIKRMPKTTLQSFLLFGKDTTTVP